MLCTYYYFFAFFHYLLLLWLFLSKTSHTLACSAPARAKRLTAQLLVQQPEGPSHPMDLSAVGPKARVKLLHIFAGDDSFILRTFGNHCHVQLQPAVQTRLLHILQALSAPAVLQDSNSVCRGALSGRAVPQDSSNSINRGSEPSVTPLPEDPSSSRDGLPEHWQAARHSTPGETPSAGGLPQSIKASTLAAAAATAAAAAATAAAAAATAAAAAAAAAASGSRGGLPEAGWQALSSPSKPLQDKPAAMSQQQVSNGQVSCSCALLLIETC